MMYTKKAIGQMIGRLRTKKDMSQEVLSGLSGLSRSHLAMLENGKKMPSVETLSKISAALNLRLSDFFRMMEEAAALDTQRGGGYNEEKNGTEKEKRI